jgi:hypothetical protein
MRAVVYTAIFGGYDTLKPPPPQDEPCDFICFTDGEMPSPVGAWRVIRVKADHKVHPRIQAKQFKILSHNVSSDSRYAPLWIRRGVDLSIWIDASLQITSSTFVTDMRNKLGDGDWAMFVHPDRDCIYEEALVSVTMAKYQDVPILPQVETYRSVVPPHGGLYACTVIVRREPSAERLKRVHMLWWEENIKWTYQDQLSLPFVLRCVGGCDPVGISDSLWFTENNKDHELDASLCPPRCFVDQYKRCGDLIALAWPSAIEDGWEPSRRRVVCTRRSSGQERLPGHALEFAGRHDRVAARVRFVVPLHVRESGAVVDHQPQ